MDIIIRPLEKKDAYTSWKWRNDPEIFKNTGRNYSGPVRLEDELKWIREVLNRPDERRFAIMADDVYVGNVYLTGITPTEAEIGIFIGEKSRWNHGIGTKSYLLVLDFAFRQLNLSCVKSIVRKENSASLKMHKKVGFQTTQIDPDFFSLTINSDDFSS